MLKLSGVSKAWSLHKCLLIGLIAVVSSDVMAQQTDALAQQAVENSNFLRSVRSAFDQDNISIQDPDQDLTREYYQRTVEANEPKLDTNIPTQKMREEGPRILVKKFEFLRLVEFPEAGITRAEVETRAEELRRSYMKEDEIFASGYTRTELEELADQLTKINAIDDPSSLSGSDLQQLVAVMRRQKAERGVSYADLEEITSELTAYYRTQGLFLAQVQIPAQEVEAGVITLTVQEGVLGKVAVEDNKGYGFKLLTQPFKNDIGQLVSHDEVEEGLYLLNDLPGLNVTGYFSAGDAPGETALNLKVREEDRWSATVRADNHGSTFTGDQRLYTLFDALNPLGIGDALTIGYLKSNSYEDFDNDFGSDLGQFKYSLPVFGPRTRFEISADYNQFVLLDRDDEDNPVNGLEIEGVNETYAASLDHKFYRSRAFNLSGALSFTDKQTQIDSNVNSAVSGDHVRGGELGFYVDGLGETVQMLNMANMKLQYGEHQNEVDAARGDDFYKFALDTNSLFFVPLPFTDSSSRMVLKSRWQYSDSALPAFEQLSMGGANGVRGYTVRDISADQAALLNLEWYFPLPNALNPTIWADNRLNDVLQLGLIADAAYGTINNYDEEVADQWARLASAGLMIKLNWEEFFAAQISVSHPLMSESSETLDPINGEFGDDAKSAQVYADFSFFF